MTEAVLIVALWGTGLIMGFVLGLLWANKAMRVYMAKVMRMSREELAVERFRLWQKKTGAR